ncbi:MAG TPA: hypothetical protein EYH34_18855 [Planctomycetes bacterium]|nr:hypothetical protein [Planctomycetota bacterium]
MAQSVASLADFLVVGEDAVHRTDRAGIFATIPQRRVPFGRGLVGKRPAVQHVEHLPAFLVAGQIDLLALQLAVQHVKHLLAFLVRGGRVPACAVA